MTAADGRTERARVQRQERRAQILAAALGVFAAKGYHQASIADIVEAAGVARGTFYAYFDSKHEIFLQLLDDLLSTFRESVRGIDVTPDARPIPEQLEDTVVRILDAAAHGRALATLIFREAVGLDERVDARIHEFEDRLHTYVRESLDNGVRLGLLRPHDTEVVATCIYGGIRQIISRWFVTEAADSVDRRRIAKALVDHHLHGVLPG